MTPGASVWHWVAVAVAVVVLFGPNRGRRFLVDLKQSINAWKTGDLSSAPQLSPADGKRMFYEVALLFAAMLIFELAFA